MELSKGDGLIPLSMKWFKPFEKEGAHWNGDLYQWEWPNGAIIGFGHLDTENNKFNYTGLSYQFIGFDEVTTQPFENYEFMFSRLVRNTTQEALGIPLRVRCTTNPGGPHGDWVYERFINKESRYAIKQEIVRQAVVNKGMKPEEITAEYIRYRMPKFIPSLVRDNPYIDRVTYEDSVANMDPVLREQLLEGNWEIRAVGNTFNRKWFDRIPSAKCPPDWDLKKVRYWDLAATKNGDATVGCKLGLDQQSGLFYLMDMKILHLTPREVEREIWHCCYEDGADTTVVMEREPGSAGINNIENYKRRIIPPGWRFKEDRVSGDKMARARPVSAAAEKKLIKILDTRAVNRWYKTVMEQLEGFPESKNDDCVDGMSGAFNFLAHKTLHTGKYIGKVDWMTPGNTYVPFGDKTETSSPLLNVLRNKKINF